MRVFASFALVLSLAAQIAHAESSAPDAAELTRRVQAFYEATKDYTADVSQAYTFRAMRRTMRASGVMQLKKPGLMRWEISSPVPKLFVIDGEGNENRLDFSKPRINSGIDAARFKFTVPKGATVTER